MKNYGNAFILSAAGLTFLSILTIQPAADAHQMAAIFAPWMSQDDILRRLDDLDLRYVRQGWNASVLIVDVSADPSLRRSLADRSLFLADVDLVAICMR